MNNKDLLLDTGLMLALIGILSVMIQAVFGLGWMWSCSIGVAITYVAVKLCGINKYDEEDGNNE